MASRYAHDIPAYAGAGHTGYYNFPPTGTHLPPMMPSAYTPSQPIPIPKSHKKPAMSDSYADHAMKKFSDHAYNCPTCYDPLTVHLEGRQLCHTGHKLARKVSKALYEAAEEKYRVTNPANRRLDGQSMIEVNIPRGCEIVKSLLKAMECGLRVRSSSDVPATPVRSDFEGYQVPHRSGPASDEQLYRSRPVHREQGSRARSRSAKRSSSVSAAQRRPAPVQQPVGVQERERRPYGTSHSSNNSVDSGYDTAPGSPDVRRGSQYAEDMKRRQERPKSILKKTLSFEREHLLENEPSTPRSPKEKYVVFNIRGECLAPGFP